MGHPGIRWPALGPDGVRWRDWEVVGWAVRDPEGLYLTSLRRWDRVERQAILLREEPSKELRRHLRWSGFRVVRVVRRVRDVGAETLRASVCQGREAGACHGSQGWERALGCTGTVEPSGAGACSLGERRWYWWWGEWFPQFSGAEVLEWARAEGAVRAWVWRC